MRREFLLLGILMLSALVGGLWNLGRVGASIQLACPYFSAGVSVGNIESMLLTETSGIVASRKNANVLWAHNDSGDSARIFAMSTSGRHLGIYNLVGATNVDWEDIATAQGYLYIGDTGDNARTRTSIAVYRVPEPSVSATQSPVTVDLMNWDKLPMQYPSTRYDAETLLVDPISGDLFIVTRDRVGEGVVRVFRNPAPYRCPGGASQPGGHCHTRTCRDDSTHYRSQRGRRFADGRCDPVAIAFVFYTSAKSLLDARVGNEFVGCLFATTMLDAVGERAAR